VFIGFVPVERSLADKNFRATLVSRTRASRYTKCTAKNGWATLCYAFCSLVKRKRKSISKMPKVRAREVTGRSRRKQGARPKPATRAAPFADFLIAGATGSHRRVASTMTRGARVRLKPAAAFRGVEPECLRSVPIAIWHHCCQRCRIAGPHVRTAVDSEPRTEPSRLFARKRLSAPHSPSRWRNQVCSCIACGSVRSSNPKIAAVDSRKRSGCLRSQ